MSEATRTEVEEREALVQEMLRDTKPVELPSDLTAHPVIHKGDESLEAPMIVREITSAGYVYVWDTKSFEKIPILYYMLPAKMRERRPDGSYRFTTNEPKEKPYRGSIKCFLHKDDPNRKHYDELGFRYCTKENLTNPYQRERHMQMKHSKEWASIENEKKEKERLEDRELQRAILGRVAQPEVNRSEDPVYLKRVGNMAKAREARKK